MNLTNRSEVTTKYEKRIKSNLYIFSYVTFGVLLLSIIGGLLLSMISADVSLYFILSLFIAYFLFIITFTTIILKKIRVERIKYADFYKSYDEDSIYTKFDALVFVNGKRSHLKKPVLMDKLGFQNEDFRVDWQDYNIELSSNDLFGQSQLLLNLIAKSGNSIVSIGVTPKSFYLLKKYCGLDPKMLKDIEDWLNVCFQLNISIKGKNTIPDGAKKFKSFGAAVYTLILLGIIGVCIPLAYLAVKIKLDSTLLTIILVPIILGIVLPLINKLPRGTTYISKDLVSCRSLIGVINIELSKAKVTISKCFIKFSTATLSITIFKTKKALKWVQLCTGIVNSDIKQ